MIRKDRKDLGNTLPEKKSELGCCKGIFPFRGQEKETRAVRV